MPFDGNPEQFAKPDVFSLDGLIAWLRTQPGGMAYCASSPSQCLWGNYTRALGGEKLDHTTYRIGRVAHKLTYDDKMVAGFHLHSAPEHTYAAALSRALALKDKLNETTIAAE